MGKCLTWANLRKRGFQGPGRCALCCCEEENISHLFFLCPVTRSLWRIFSVFHMDPHWIPMDFITAVNEWGKLKSSYYVLPFFLIWEVWVARNRLIFEGVPFRLDQTYTYIKRWIDERPQRTVKETDCSVRLRPHDISIPAIFFDGASVDNSTGCGFWIKLSANERIHCYWNGGPGSNNKAELMALWGVFGWPPTYPYRIFTYMGIRRLLLDGFQIVITCFPLIFVDGWHAHRIYGIGC